jgi:streptogramin lyase
VAEGIASPTAVVEGPQGEVYVLSKAGAVYRLDPAA